MRSYVGAGRFGKGNGIVSTLGPQAMAKRRDEAVVRRVQASQGMSIWFTTASMLC